jgi:hypothetical protein
MIARLLLALVIAILTALAVARVMDVETVRTIVLAHAGLSVVALTLNVTGRRRLSAVVDRIRDAAPVVATGLVEAPPLDVAALIAEVRKLGFDMAGATDTTLGGPPIRTWVLLESRGEAWAEIGIGVQPMVIFLSEATGGRLIETAYPVGETIDNEAMRARSVATSPADALAAQREAVRVAGGSGRTVVTLEDYLAAEADQRATTGGMRIASHLAGSVEPAIRDWSISLVVDLVAIAALAFLAPATAPG